MGFVWRLPWANVHAFVQRSTMGCVRNRQTSAALNRLFAPMLWWSGAIGFIRQSLIMQWLCFRALE